MSAYSLGYTFPFTKSRDTVTIKSNSLPNVQVTSQSMNKQEMTTKQQKSASEEAVLEEFGNFWELHSVLCG